MSLAAGTITQVSVGGTTAQLSVSAATGGTTPYAYQWYRSTTNGFTPGAGSLISGATSLVLNDSGLIPNTVYYYKNRVTDFASATSDTAQSTVTTTAQSLSQNAYQQTPVLGQIDQRFDYNTTPVQVDSSQSGSLYPGSAVKIVDNADGVPKVIGCTANADSVLGFLNYDFKNQSFVANQPCQISGEGNVIYLYTTGAVARGARVSLDVSSPGCVRSAAGNTGDTVVGWAFDQSQGAGDLIRVKLLTPSFTVVNF